MGRRWPVLLVFTGAFWLLLLLASAASADITDPSRPFTPIEPKVKAAASPAPVPVVPHASPVVASPEPVASPVPTAEPVVQEPVASPVVSTAPVGGPELERPPVRVRSRLVAGGAAAAAPRTEPVEEVRKPFEPVVETVDRATVNVREFLAEVVSACEVGVGTGSGGPALVLAVLGMATAFAGRRVLRGSWTTDEDAPEFLFAWDVIAPG